jgi:flagellar basal body-associated protein FliL
MINNKKGGAGIVILIIILILLGIGAYVLISSGTLEKAVDPCEREFSDCNHACGEGILSSVCKEKCSYDYRSCKNG